MFGSRNFSKPLAAAVVSIALIANPIAPAPAQALDLFKMSSSWNDKGNGGFFSFTTSMASMVFSCKVNPRRVWCPKR
ncbi:hypothetical protein CMUST_14115 [Corynebacterium mustelae]|uniref:Uncharacterized protein n=1 Tax=Corynebacterium mustelae TaxID=571915 RepID=A0A0G3H168_9CORY|nr:hypothetical protein CMUST_14115 [Corynebacterium mustelae]